MKNIRDAAAAVLCHEEKIFVVQRSYALKAFPGYWAFPGGKVETEDDVAVLPEDFAKGLPRNLMAGLMRELQEELGVDLVKEWQNGNILEILPLGLAVTPDFNPQRFATHFFKIVFRSIPHLVVDLREARQTDWFACSALMSRYEEGELLAVPPVIEIIRALGKDIHTKKIERLAFTYKGEIEVPMIESIRGVRQFMPLSNTLPPANRTNGFLIGDDDALCILIDPSPKDASEMTKFMTSLSSYRVDAILFTHHHADHHEFAPAMARQINVPVFLSSDTRERLTLLRPQYLEGLKLREVVDGELLTRWLGHPVHVYAIPGHDEGQVALAPANMAWFLAGDLFQGVGTVVIGGDEGDMAKYMATLRKVIALKPRVVFPSHGIGLGSTAVLEKTLEHRLMREAEVLRLTKMGKTEKEVLSALYADVPAALHPYAMANIRSHLKKLREEGALA